MISCGVFEHRQPEVHAYDCRRKLLLKKERLVGLPPIPKVGVLCDGVFKMRYAVRSRKREAQARTLSTLAGSDVITPTEVNAIPALATLGYIWSNQS